MTSAMGLKVYPPARLWLLAIAVMLISAVFIQLLVQINSAIPLSGHWKELRSAQEEVDKMVEAFFSGAGTGRFLVLTLVVALLPAVAEELCFRGTIQQTLMQTHLGPIGAIIVSGLTFSLFHFEFDNFLAIWCMGIVLGYLYYYSGSIWVSMSAHFFNNFIMVAGKYAYMKGLLHMDIMSNDTLPLYITIPAGGLMIAGLVLMHRWRQSPTISLADVQEDHRTPPGKTNTDGANNID
jgi:membrane protease YdiL (CAAX protease family)